MTGNNQTEVWNQQNRTESHIDNQRNQELVIEKINKIDEVYSNQSEGRERTLKLRRWEMKRGYNNRHWGSSENY